MTATLCSPLWPVDAPPLRPSSGGLLAYADRPIPAGALTVLRPGGTQPPVEPERWEAGFIFRAYTCDGTVTFLNDYSLGIYPDGGGEQGYKLAALGEGGDFVEFIPYNLIGALECSVMGFDPLDDETQAMMTATLSDAIEYELWAGHSSADNQHLADGTAYALHSGTAVSLGEALALMDQGLSSTLHGALGMVHVTPHLLTTILTTLSVALRWAGDRWVTPNGHTVVPGSGYTGGGPRNGGGVLPAPPDLLAFPAANEWMYGTGPVQVRLAPVVRATPDPVTQLNRENNRQRFIVERTAAAYYSPCAHFAAQVDLTP